MARALHFLLSRQSGLAVGFSFILAVALFMASRDGKAVHAKSRKGVIVLIARADRFYSEVLPALQNFEFFFNARFQYPYVILSEDPIDEYQQLQLSSLSQGKASWGQSVRRLVTRYSA